MSSPHTDLERGRRASAACDWVTAEAAFRAALARDPEHPDALEGLGWALWWQDRATESLEARERAYRGFAGAGDSRGAARVAAGIAIDIVDHQGPAVMRGWLRRGRRHLEGIETTPEHGWLALWEGHHARLYEGDLERARRGAAEARDIGRRLGVGDLELLGLALEGAALVSEGRVDEGMQRLDEATAAAIAGEITNLDAAAVACCFLMHACEQVRDLDRAAQWVERVNDFVGQWRIPPLFAVCRVHRAALQIACGQWAEAEVQLDRVNRELAAVPGPARSEALLHLAELRRRQGRWEEADRLFDEVDSFSLAQLGRAAMALDRGDAPAAVRGLARCLRRAAPDNWTLRANALLLMAEAHGALGEEALAAGSLDDLRALTQRVRTDYVHATTRLAEGGAAVSAGEHEDARRALEDAVDLFERCGAPYEAARARLVLAESLRARGLEAEGRREGERARDAFVRLGALRDAERAAAVWTPAPAAAPGGAGPRLTPREREVLAHVAEGLADKEIAARLGLSEHTVHRHVSNVLVRLGAPSRTAAVVLALRHGLL